MDVPAGDLNHDGFVGSTTTASSWSNAYSATQLSAFDVSEYWPTLQGYVSSANSPYYKADGTGLNPALVQGGGWAAAGDEAHFYAECSGKGACDRKSGACYCYAGFDGAACQRSASACLSVMCSELKVDISVPRFPRHTIPAYILQRNVHQNALGTVSAALFAKLPRQRQQSG